ncbi:MAG: thioredoxin [bacterium]
MSEIIFTDENFEVEALKSAQPVLIDFFADWCGPCKLQAPIIEEVAKEMAGKAKVGKLNVDTAPEVAGKYGIMSIPTLLILKNGQVVEQMMGLHTKDMLIEKLNKAL